MNKNDLARMIDHTILKADATEKEIDVLCKVPSPSIDTSKRALVIIRPSSKVQVP